MTDYNRCKWNIQCRFSGLVLIITFFTVLYLAQPVPAAEVSVPRLRSDDPKGIEQVRKLIAADKGFSIVFLGDSAFYCSGTRDNRLTIPSAMANQLQAKLKRSDITVYNLSLPDCSMVNCLDILTYILPARPDMVVFDLNIGWLGMNTKPHPVLTNLNAKVKNPSLKITPVPNSFPGTNIPWYQKDFSGLKKARGKLGDFSISNSNPQWMALNNIINLLATTDTLGVMVYPPRNRTIYQKYNLLDDKLLQERLSVISTLTTSCQVYFLDYTWRFHSNYFADNIHLLPAANGIMAEMLCNDTIKLELYDQAKSKSAEGR